MGAKRRRRGCDPSPSVAVAAVRIMRYFEHFDIGDDFYVDAGAISGN